MDDQQMIYRPRIMKETHQGVNTISLVDDMFARREIECVGLIERELVYSLISQIRQLYAEDAEKEITIFINSPGGSVTDGMALYDVMEAVKCPIRTVCMGMAASMGSLLFVAGDKREMLPHARLMLHDPLIRETGGSALSLKSISDDLMRTREMICHVYAEKTGKTLEEIYEVTRTDSYFYAEEAVTFGLADYIIREL